MILSLARERRDDVAKLLPLVLDPGRHAYRAEQLQTFERFLEAMSRYKTSLEKMLTSTNDLLARELSKAEDLVAFAHNVVDDDTQTLDLRLAATTVLGHTARERDEDVVMLAELLTPRTPAELQRAAIKALGRIGDASTPKALLKHWTQQAPDLRRALVNELLSREAWTLALLKRIASGQISPHDLDTPRRQRLLKHRSGKIHALTENVFNAVMNSDRQKVIEEFRPALTLKSDAQRGAPIFNRVCATCHKLDGVGHEIGPNLRALTDSREELLVSILDPSRAIEPKYLAYTCVLDGDEEVYGIIAGETGAAITLKLADDTTRTILRSEIKVLTSASVSLMPEGLETGLTRQDVADLLEFLRPSVSPR